MHPYSRSWGQGYTSAHVADKCIPGRRICGNIWRWAVGWLRLRRTSPASIALTDRGSRHRSSSTCSRCTTSSRRLIRWTSSFRSSFRARRRRFRSAVIDFYESSRWKFMWAPWATEGTERKKRLVFFSSVFVMTYVATRVPFFSSETMICDRICVWKIISILLLLLLLLVDTKKCYRRRYWNY